MLKNKFTKALALAAAGCLLAFGCVALAGCGGGGASSSSSSAGTESASSAASQSSATAADFKLVEEGKLTIGSDLDFPPMEYLDGDEPAGFGIAMIKEICDRIGLKANILPPQNFDTLVTQVAGGSSLDVAVSSMTITDERKDLIDFSTPYYDSNLAMVVSKDSNYEEKEDLYGKTVGVQSGSSGEDWAKENLKDTKVKPYNGPSDALAALRTDDVQAVIYDLPVAQNHVNGEYKDDARILEEIPTGEQYGIAVNKDNAALTAAIDQALADMEADGTMDALKDKWIEGK